MEELREKNFWLGERERHEKNKLHSIFSKIYAKKIKAGGGGRGEGSFSEEENGGSR